MGGFGKDKKQLSTRWTRTPWRSRCQSRSRRFLPPSSSKTGHAPVQHHPVDLLAQVCRGVPGRQASSRPTTSGSTMLSFRCPLESNRPRSSLIRLGQKPVTREFPS